MRDFLIGLAIEGEEVVIGGLQGRGFVDVGVGGEVNLHREGRVGRSLVFRGGSGVGIGLLFFEGVVWNVIHWGLLNDYYSLLLLEMVS